MTGVKKYSRILLSILLFFVLLFGVCTRSGTSGNEASAPADNRSASSVQSRPAGSEAGSVLPETVPSGPAVRSGSTQDQPEDQQAGGQRSAAGGAKASSANAETAAEPSASAPKAKPAAGKVSPKPTPSAAPVPESSVADLEKTLEEMLRSFDGTWSVYFKRMDTEESFCINDSAMAAASLIKLYVFGAVMEDIENGWMDYEEWYEPLELMTVYSDNDSCNLLIDAAGGFDYINDFIKQKGFESTELNRYMLGDRSAENYTTAKETGELLEQALNGTYVSEEASDLLLGHLENQYTLSKIPAGVPEGVKTANKTGELEDAEHDAAIVWSPACTYILVVMSNDLTPYNNDGIARICEISKTVYNYINDTDAKSSNG